MKLFKGSCDLAAAQRASCRSVAATFTPRCTGASGSVNAGTITGSRCAPSGLPLSHRRGLLRAAAASATAPDAGAPESAPGSSAPTQPQPPNLNNDNSTAPVSETSNASATSARHGKNRRAGGGRGSATHGPRTRGTTPAAAAAAAQAAADALFRDPGPEPLRTPRYGAVRVAELGGGRGRGLLTTRTVQPGELLLAVRPLALAWDEQDDNVVQAGQTSSSSAPLSSSDAKFLSLQRQLLGRRYSVSEAAWLNSLAGLPLPVEDEEEGGGQLRGQDKGGLAATVTAIGSAARPMPPELEGAAEGQEADAAASSEERRELPLPEHLRDPDELADVVQANYLEPDGGAEDEHAYLARRPAAWRGAKEERPGGRAQRRGRAQGVGPMGLWPEAAFLNHSCLPNTVAYVVGDTLFVRAARKVGGGAELTVSYLPVGGGADTTYADDADDADDAEDGAAEDGTAVAASEPSVTLLSPLEDRRAALEEARGFVCGCPRCVAEEALDPKLRGLMADVTSGVAALREDLENALAIAALRGDDGEDNDDEGEEEEKVEAAERRESRSSGRGSGPSFSPASSATAASRNLRRGGRGRVGGGSEADEEGEEEAEDGEEGGAGGRWRQLAGSVADRAGMYVELLDAAMSKLKLTPAQQMTVQSAVVPLYTVLWAALAVRGELEPRLAEVVTALVGEVAPGSADHLWWAAVARDTAEMIVAEEEALSDSGTVVRRGSGGFSSGFKRLDERVALADKACFRAYGIRYGPISRGVYRQLLEARRQREGMDEEEEEAAEEGPGAV